MTDSIEGDSQSQTTSKKRLLDDGEKDVDPLPKKVRLSDFKSALNGPEKNKALCEFLAILKQDPGCVCSFLEKGGHPKEILDSCLKLEPRSAPEVVFDVVTKILLQIAANFVTFQKIALDTSKLLLSDYLELINKMVGLNSSLIERKSALELLTVIVTLSADLAKQVLISVNFNKTNVEVLVKGGAKHHIVRDTFVRFIMAFLVDGHYPSISILMEKKGLMSSIIPGLKFDSVETVVLVLGVMKGHILENPSVSKTNKMKVFNTRVVRDIVNLYNWKGPSGLAESKGKQAPPSEVEKSKVNEAVHGFLLVLCTSHRFGVIFRDHLMGLGNKKVNALMYTVMESLERPWEHSYASELMVKICGACPDLAKTMWTSLNAALEPRNTVKWLKAVTFAIRLLEELTLPKFESKDLNVHQITQIVTILATPLPVIKTISTLPESTDRSVKINVLNLLSKMAESVEKFSVKIRTLPNIDANTFDSIVSKVFARNFPSGNFVLADWNRSDPENADVALNEYLEVALGLLHKYKTLCPALIEDFLVNFDIKEFLDTLQSEDDESSSLKIKAAKLFIEVDPSRFSVSGELFRDVLSFTFEHYHSKRDQESFDVLVALLGGPFDGENVEVWIDGVLNLKELDGQIPDILLDIASCSDKLASLGSSVTKALKPYANFVVLNLYYSGQISEKMDFVSTDLRKYMTSWSKGKVCELDSKLKGPCFEDFRLFHRHFFENIPLESSSFPNKYPHLDLYLLNGGMFYLTKCIENKIVEQKHFDFIKNFVIQNKDEFAQVVLENRSILDSLTFDAEDMCTKFVIEIIKNKRDALDLNRFRLKMVEELKHRVLSAETLQVFELTDEQCVTVLGRILKKPSPEYCEVVCYCLDQLHSRIIPNQMLMELSSYFVQSHTPKLSTSFLAYLKRFPHCIEYLGTEPFEKLLSIAEYNKDNMSLASFLLERNHDLIRVVEKNFEEVVSRKSVILPILDTILKIPDTEAIANKIYEKIQSSLLKALHKPHKAGQHFQHHYVGVGKLIEKFWKDDAFSKTIKKSEGQLEQFYVYLLAKIFEKANDKKVAVMSFVHILTGVLKKLPNDLLDFTCKIFLGLLAGVDEDLSSLCQNETFRMLFELCLDHMEESQLISISTKLARLSFGSDEAKSVAEMVFGHPKFFNVVSGEANGSLLELWQVLVEKSEEVMEPSHVPILLAAYRGTRSERTTLDLLKKYASKPEQTQFYNCKPFLWGPAAASHYSIRTAERLWRQPKMSDILANIEEPIVHDTIINPDSPNAYDLEFFLPLFSHLLYLSGTIVQTYHFTKRGALSLTVAGLRNENKTIRLMSCLVLQRFHYHMGARTTGKDNLLWLRFVEVIRKGINDDVKLNNFAGIFLARTALILTQPLHPMYKPLSQYLAAKDTLELDTIPELYTLLHSPDVDFKTHRNFVLEVIRDGLKGETDIQTLLQSMGFKLISEIANSSICDNDTLMLILEIFKACVDISLGAKVLGNLCLLPQILGVFGCLKGHSEKDLTRRNLVKLLLEILYEFVVKDEDKLRNFQLFINLLLVKSGVVDVDIVGFYRILIVIAQRYPEFFANEMDKLVEDDDYCKYLLRCGCKFVQEEDLDCESKFYNLRFLILTLNR